MQAIQQNRTQSNIRDNHERADFEFPFLDPVYSAAETSNHLIVSNSFHFRIGGRRFTIPKFLHLGERGGGAPYEIGIFAGINPGEESTSHAAANLLIDLEWIPDVARNYVLFNYPVVNPRAYSNRREDAPNLNELFWQRSAEPEVSFIEKEFQRHAFNGFITYQLDADSNGFYASTPSRVIAGEVLRKAVNAAALAIPLDANPIRILEVSRSGRVAGQPKGRMSAPRTAHSSPFEVTLHAGASVAPEAQTAGFVIATKMILREYRKFISHAQNL